MRKVAIVQARMGSKRLPGKVLMPIAGRPLLQHLLERLQCASCLEQIVVATGDRPANQPIIELSERLGVPCFVGSEEDVLGRYVAAARAFQADVVVRVTADNPLADPEVIEALVKARAKADADLAQPQELMEGVGSEVTTCAALERAAQLSNDPSHREHVTIFMKERPDLFSIVSWRPRGTLRRPNLSVTVDTPADLARLQALCEALIDQAPFYRWPDVVAWLDGQGTRRDRRS